VEIAGDHFNLLRPPRIHEWAEQAAAFFNIPEITDKN